MNPQTSQTLQQVQEIKQSVLSYGVGGGGALLSSMLNVADYFQAIGIMLGCLVIFVRLVHDVIRLVRYVKNEE